MYNCTIDAQTLLHINNVLKEQGFEASLHSVNGCSHDSVELRNLIPENRDKVIALVTSLLKDKFLRLEPLDNDPNAFRVRSTFN